jgi:hypothetical protein
MVAGMTTITDNSEKSPNGDTENVFEAKAREILETWTLSGPVGAAIGEFDDLVSAIAAALEAERLDEREHAVAKLLPAKEMLAQACASDWPLSGADVANRLIEAGFLTVAEFADLVEPHDQDCAASIRSRETDNG